MSPRRVAQWAFVAFMLGRASTLGLPLGRPGAMPLLLVLFFAPLLFPEERKS